MSDIRPLFKNVGGNQFRLMKESPQSDPTKEEMLEFLRKNFGNEEGFEDDAEIAMYWFATHYHGGQFSNLYSVLSNSYFSPGPISNGPQKESMEEMMYQDLVHEFGGNQTNENSDFGFCSACQGSGEGQNDGSVCNKCHGSGNEHSSRKLTKRTDPDYDWDSEEEERKIQPSILAEALQEMAKEGQVDKVTDKERRLIGKVFTKMGLDGNGRFQSPGKGLAAVTDSLSQIGFALNMVTGRLDNKKGNMLLPYRRSNDEGQDAFTDKPDIKNSAISFSWENLSNEGQEPRYEVLAYAS